MSSRTYDFHGRRLRVTTLDGHTYASATSLLSCLDIREPDYFQQWAAELLSERDYAWSSLGVSGGKHRMLWFRLTAVMQIAYLWERDDAERFRPFIAKVIEEELHRIVSRNDTQQELAEIKGQLESLSKVVGEVVSAGREVVSEAVSKPVRRGFMGWLKAA